MSVGQVVLDRLNSSVRIRKKEFDSLVTDVDRETEQLIIEAIKQEYPDHYILSEESNSNLKPSSTDSPIWIIDPLDGTTNYAHGYPVFAINLAFGHQNGLDIDISEGITYIPSLRELFYAKRGCGAYLNDKAIHVSETDTMSEAFISFDYSRKRDVLDNWTTFNQNFYQIFKNCRTIRRDGSIGFDLAFVAAGRYDFFWGLDYELWDIHPGKLLVEEAGGTVITLNNRALLASNKNLCDIANLIIK